MDKIKDIAYEKGEIKFNVNKDFTIDYEITLKTEHDYVVFNVCQKDFNLNIFGSMFWLMTREERESFFIKREVPIFKFKSGTMSIHKYEDKSYWCELSLISDELKNEKFKDMCSYISFYTDEV
ncbi:hypothetical protein [Breznakia pachnodae]|uniref:Uncharacterized protein n=1 Tax=Breznakia pachnodae TaxID=265178 RepID=A0ABU0DZD9_9FIRM|nr:hypothetical protein [Breznakia pachnodae]MDQ0360002.1 hypothetical protein [Breznakia pachnodae]